MLRLDPAEVLVFDEEVKAFATEGMEDQRGNYDK